MEEVLRSREAILEMKSISSDPLILAMANGLKLAPGDPVQQILVFCRDRIRGWMRKYKSTQSILDLERIVCEELNLTIREIWRDEDLDDLITEHVEAGDPAFALLRADLDENTFATLMQCRQFNPKAPAAYVAVIDCRGEKRHRRFFTRWHEIAHLLTLYTQLELPFHRSTNEKNATEQMMDLIAGEVGFLEELFSPLLENEFGKFGRPTFEGVDNVRNCFCSDASFQATLNACVNKARRPTVLLELGLGYKRSELRELQEATSSCSRKRIKTNPVPKLRVLNVLPNAAARQFGLQVHKNMRVPERSVLTKLFKSQAQPDFESSEAVEKLGGWTTSTGEALPDFQVHVEAIRIQGKVLALVTPTDAELPDAFAD